jgi:hypothetical protein
MKLKIIDVSFVLLVALVFVLIMASVTQASIGGHVSGNYDFVSETYYWEVEVNKNLFGFLTVGTSFGTPTPELVIKSFVPSGVPTRIDYKLYAEVKIKDVSVRLTDWCDHWLVQHTDYMKPQQDKWGLQLQVKYEF